MMAGGEKDPLTAAPPMKLPLDRILTGDCIAIMDTLPEKSVDLIFADPPYNLQLQQDLWRPNMTRVDAVNDSWDHFDSFEQYDEFTNRWLGACRRILKDSGTIWVIGSYHNIFRIGAIMQDMGFWFLNDIIWIKTNPMPNFRGVRFTNAHETLIWAGKSKNGSYTFNHHAMKSMNDELQMRSDWLLPICAGRERIRDNGKKAHATQKPEALLYRVILSSSSPGDIILDPFFGSGTTGAVAKRLHRRWIGIERSPEYVAVAEKRLAWVVPDPYDDSTFDVSDRRRLQPRVPFGALLENGLIRPGQALFFKRNRSFTARVRADGKISCNGMEGSIHQVGSQLSGGSPCNGWEHWYYETEDGALIVLDELRQVIRSIPEETT